MAVSAGGGDGELEERCLEGDVTDQWQGVRGWQSGKEENLEQLPGFLIDQILGMLEKGKEEQFRTCHVLG